MRAIIKYYIKGKRNSITKYVDDLKFTGLIEEALKTPIDPDYISRFKMVADFEYESVKKSQEVVKNG